MNWPKKVLKSIAVFLSAALFTTNVLLAHSPETNFWKEREKNSVQLARLPASLPTLPTLPTLARPTASVSKQIQKHIPRGQENHFASLIGALPQNIGSIRKVSVPRSFAGKKTVIQIQDVHLNPEAQNNIAQTVQELIQQKKIGLVALEGAFGPEDFSVYHNFPYQDSVKAVADYLLRENKISGPVHTLFLAKGDTPAVVGIDDKFHYDANVDAYKESAPLMKSHQARLTKKIQTLAQDKAKSFNADLQKFDARVQAYRQGQMSWGDYVRTLVKHSDKTTHEIDVFVEALNQEASLNFPRVESERTELLTKLIAKMSEAQSTELLNHSAAYRVGTLSHTDFYEYIKQLCAQHKISLSHFKSMDGYIRYVLLSDAINVEKVLKDVAVLEKSIYESLAMTSEEKQLVHADRSLALTKKLLDFSLTKAEWIEYQKRGEEYSSFEQFYEEAIARDTAMTTNLLRAMNENKTNVAVLVTGGFHSEGMAKQLLDKGVAIITYAPKITKVEDEMGTSYLSVFTQEKTPLDKLFAGEKLFVPPHVTVPHAATIPLVKAHQQAMATGTENATIAADGATYSVTVDLPSGKIESATAEPVAASRKSLNAEDDPLIGLEIQQSAEMLAAIKPLITRTLAGFASIGKWMRNLFKGSNSATTLLMAPILFLVSCVGSLSQFQAGRVVPFSNAISADFPNQIFSTLDVDSDFSIALLKEKELDLRISSDSIFTDEAAQKIAVVFYGEQNKILFQQELVRQNGLWQKTPESNNLAASDRTGAFFTIPTSLLQGARITRLETRVKLNNGYELKRSKQVTIHPKTNHKSITYGPIPLKVGIFSLGIPLQQPKPVQPRSNFRYGRKAFLAFFLTTALSMLNSPNLTAQTQATQQNPAAVTAQQDPAVPNITIALNEEYGGGTGETWKGRWSNVTPEQADAMAKASSLKFTLAPPSLDELTGFHIQLDGGSAFGFRLFAKKVDGQWGVYAQGKTLDPKTGTKITVEGNFVVVVIPAAEISAANPVSKIHLHSGQEQNGVKLNAQNVRPDVVVEIIPRKATDPAPTNQPTAQGNKPTPIYPSIAPTKPQNEIVSVVRNEQGVWMNVKGELWSGAPGVAYQPTPNNQHITAFHHGRMALLYRALLPSKEKWTAADKDQYPELWNLVVKDDTNAAAPQDHARMIADAGFKFIRTYNLATTDEADLQLVSKIFQWMFEKYDVRFVAGLYDPTKTDIEKVIKVLANNPALLHYDGWNEIDLRGGTAEDIQKIDELAGHLKKLDPNHPVTLVVTQTISPDLAAVVRDTKNIDIVGLTIYNRPGYDASKFVASMQTFFSPKVVIVSEYGVRSDKHSPAERAGMLEEFQRNMTMTVPGRPTAAPLHVQFYWNQEAWKGDDRHWELVDAANQPTAALKAVADVNRRWVLAKKQAAPTKVEPIVEKPVTLQPQELEAPKSESFSIDLEDVYGGKEGDSHYGRFRKLGDADSKSLLGETHIKISITTQKMEAFSGFHIDFKNKSGFTGFGLYGKKEKNGTWGLINKDGSPNTVSGARIALEGNNLVLLIPRTEIKMDSVSQVHVQTGKQQNRVTLNETNIETAVRIEAVTIPSTVPKKSGFAFFLPPLGGEPLGSGLSILLITVAILSAIALISYIAYRFNQWNKKRIGFNNLVDAIRSTVRSENLQDKTAVQVLMNINMRMPDHSFHLAHGLQLKSSSDPAKNLRKNFAVGLGLASQSGRFTGKRISNLQKEMTNAWKTYHNLATVVHIGRADDLLRLEDVLAGTQEFNKTHSTNRGIAIVLNSELGQAGLRQRADQILSRFKDVVSIAVIDEKTIPQVEGQGIPYVHLFEKLKEAFENAGHTTIAHTYQQLAQEQTSGLRLLIVGAPVTPYTASEKLLEIMISMVPIQNGTLLIDIGVVLLAAKQA